MPARLRLATITLVLLFGILPFSPTAFAESSRPRFVPVDHSAAALLQSDLDTDLRQRFPGSFASLSITPDGTVQVHMSAGSAAIAARIQAITRRVRRSASDDSALPAVQVVVDAQHSLRELTNLRDQLTSAHGTLAQRGVLLSSWGIDIEQNRVRIGVASLTPAARAMLIAMYGNDLVEVVDSPPLRTMSRYQDRSPWQSGDFIASGRVGCTTGFNFYVNGSYYLSTAGHCGSGGWYNGSGYIGQTAGMSFANYGTADAQLISPNGLVSGGVYVRNNDVTSVVSFTANSQQGVGSSICVDGSYTGEVCGVRIIAVNGCYYLTNDGIIMCGLTTARSARRAIQPGDSGGPVYRYVNGGVSAYGMLVGGDATGTQLIYSPVQNIMSVFRAALVVR